MPKCHGCLDTKDKCTNEALPQCRLCGDCASKAISYLSQYCRKLRAENNDR